MPRSLFRRGHHVTCAVVCDCSCRHTRYSDTIQHRDHLPTRFPTSKTSLGRQGRFERRQGLIWHPLRETRPAVVQVVHGHMANPAGRQQCIVSLLWLDRRQICCPSRRDGRTPGHGRILSWTSPLLSGRSARGILVDDERHPLRHDAVVRCDRRFPRGGLETTAWYARHPGLERTVWYDRE